MWTLQNILTFWKMTTLHLISFIYCFFIIIIFLLKTAHPPYLTIQPALWFSLCLSLLACNASWVELWSKHQDNRKQKALEKEQSKITSLSTQLDFPLQNCKTGTLSFYLHQSSSLKPLSIVGRNRICPQILNYFSKSPFRHVAQTFCQGRYMYTVHRYMDAKLKWRFIQSKFWGIK